MKEASRLRRLKIISRSAMVLGALSGCTAPLVPLSPAEEFASPTKPLLIETLETPPSFTPTATTEYSPTPDIAQPSVPNGLRPENASTQVVENGTWVTKNADGKITATWNEQTEKWDYKPATIKVTYTQIGNKMDTAILESHLGPLPPDDPATHFIDLKTGELVEYGIGPETELLSFGAYGKKSDPATEVFFRFRGVVPIDSNYSIMILELPQSADSSMIITRFMENTEFSIFGIAHDSQGFDQSMNIDINDLGSDVITTLANKYLIGHQVMTIIVHDTAEQYIGTEIYENHLHMDLFAKRLLANLLGTKTQPTLLQSNDLLNPLYPLILVPESQLPKP
jgi:hypothetical protein